MKDRVAVVPWYPDSACYEQFRRTAVDREDFFASHSEWIDAASAHEQIAEQRGIVILRIRMEYQTFEKWLTERGRTNGIDERSAFAEERACSLHSWYTS